MKKRPSVKADKRAADDLWRLIIHAGPCCELADELCAGPLQAAHIIRRAKSGTRTELRNGMLLCLTHHTYLDGHPADLIAHVDSTRGAGTYRRLQDQADTYKGSPITAAAFWRSERARLLDYAKALELK